MPFFASSQEWLEQSSLLLQARPTTTRITTKYTLSKPKPPRQRKPKPDDATTASAQAAATSDPNSTSQADTSTAEQATAATPKATLTLKSYDPVSGVCLKYRTERAQEVGRLIASLGRLGRHMAALPDAEEAVAAAVRGDDVAMADAGAEGDVAPAEVAAPATPAAVASSAGAGGGGGKKKKKGKK